MDASRTLKNKRGVAIVYLALLLIVLIGFAALVIDLGYMYVTKSQLQNAADAGALAGASKLNGLFTNYSAHYFAEKFASDPGNKAAGEIVPIKPNYENYAEGDTVVGCWNGAFHPTSVLNCTEANAVKVVARRTTESGPGISTNNKQVDIFLGRIFGEQWKKMSTKATAIAINQKAGIMPIAANEYWLENASSPNRPYGTDHNYPNSFVRRTNLGTLNPPSSTPNFGRVFAILGGNANNNNPPSDPGGFVALNYRNPTYDSSGQWYKVNTTVTTPATCSTCSSGFIAISPPSLNSAAVVDEAKFYLIHGGYEKNFILPTAVLEQLRVSPYPANYLSNPTSTCPYATVGYFSGSGSGIANDTDFKVGQKLITAVYDGRVENPGGGDPKNVTIVGYSLIQIDGYSNNNPKQLLDSGFFNGTKHTLYGHTLDFVEPSTSGACDESMFLKLNLMSYKAGTPKLVK